MVASVACMWTAGSRWPCVSKFGCISPNTSPQDTWVDTPTHSVGKIRTSSAISNLRVSTRTVVTRFHSPACGTGGSLLSEMRKRLASAIECRFMQPPRHRRRGRSATSPAPVDEGAAALVGVDPHLAGARAGVPAGVGAAASGVAGAGDVAVTGCVLMRPARASGPSP